MHNKLHHRQNAGVSRTGQEQGEKRCAVQSELQLAHIRKSATHMIVQLKQTLSVEDQASAPRRSLAARCSRTILYYCRVGARSTGVRRPTSTKSTSCCETSRKIRLTQEPGGRKHVACLRATHKILRQMSYVAWLKAPMSCVDSTPRPSTPKVLSLPFVPAHPALYAAKWSRVHFSCAKGCKDTK